MDILYDFNQGEFFFIIIYLLKKQTQRISR